MTESEPQDTPLEPRRLGRIAALQLARGLALLFLAAIGSIWLEILVILMAVAGAIAALTAGYELTASLSSSDRQSTKYVVTFHSAIAIGFGVVILAIAAGPLRLALTVTILWLLIHAAYVLLLARRTWHYRSPRMLLLFWGALHVVFAVVLATRRPTTGMMLLRTMAVYALFWGVAQLLASRWVQGWLWRRDTIRAAAETPPTRV